MFGLASFQACSFGIGKSRVAFDGPSSSDLKRWLTGVNYGSSKEEFVKLRIEYGNFERGLGFDDFRRSL